MGRELILADAGGTERGSVLDYDLDMGFGSDENSFDLETHEGPEPSRGWTWYVDGTEYGGVIDSMGADTSDGSVTWSGRTWHGVLAGKVLRPPAGSDWLEVSGTATEVLASLVASLGLSGTFEATEPPGGSPRVSYRFERYVGAYDGIRKMLRAHGLRLAMRREPGVVALWAEPVATYGDEVDSDRIEFKVERDWRPVNHLVCLGDGELRDRVVVDLYADASGAVSGTQTLFGADERAETYDYSNASREELVEKGTERLAGMQTQGSIDVTVPDGADYAVGDLLVGRWARTGETVTAEVTKKVVKARLGELAVSFECGATTAASSPSSGTAESTAGGHAYYAGAGLTLANYTFSADVTQDDLDAVDGRAQAAERSASGAAAAVGAKVGSVTASAPLSAARSGDSVALSVAEATARGPGSMSAADKAKLDGVEDGANRYELPPATEGAIGGVRPDGTTVTVDADGTLHASVQAGSASFLAAHPVGCVYLCVTGDPSAHGGTWRALPTMGAWAWERVS